MFWDKRAAILRTTTFASPILPQPQPICFWHFHIDCCWGTGSGGSSTSLPSSSSTTGSGWFLILGGVMGSTAIREIFGRMGKDHQISLLFSSLSSKGNSIHERKDTDVCQYKSSSLTQLILRCTDEHASITLFWVDGLICLKSIALIAVSSYIVRIVANRFIDDSMMVWYCMIIAIWKYSKYFTYFEIVDWYILFTPHITHHLSSSFIHRVPGTLWLTLVVGQGKDLKSKGCWG